MVIIIFCKHNDTHFLYANMTCARLCHQWWCIITMPSWRSLHAFQVQLGRWDVNFTICTRSFHVWHDVYCSSHPLSGSGYTVKHTHTFYFFSSFPKIKLWHVTKGKAQAPPNNIHRAWVCHDGNLKTRNCSSAYRLLLQYYLSLVNKCKCPAGFALVVHHLQSCLCYYTVN